MSRLNKLDQYYTEPKLAIKYTRDIIARYGEDNVFLEPSAGTGAFLHALEGLAYEAYDLEPKHPNVVEGDFFQQLLVRNDYITIGNPPFTFDVQMFNRCADHSEVVAFVIPRSWRKASVQNRLHANFHLVHDEDCPEHSFILDGEAWDVATCFQIWERRPEKREKIKLKNTFFDVVKREDDWDIILRNYGSRSGEVLPDDYSGNETTVRFLRSKRPGLKEAITAIDWSVRKSNVSSLPTINPIEIEQELERYFNETML